MPKKKSDTPSPKSTKRKNKSKSKNYYVNPKEFQQEIIEYHDSGKMSDMLAKNVYDIATRFSYAPNFVNYCVDEKTEALTKRGWLKYNQITKEDIILSYNIKTKNLTWSPIEDIYISNYNGYMHKLTTKGLNALVTPKHKFVTKEDDLIKVELLKSYKHLILMGNYENSQKDIVYNNDFVELVGWVVTEGHYNYGKKTHSINIFQKDGLKADRIRKCIKNLNIPYKEYIWNKNNIIGFRIIKKYANEIIKIAPDKILSMDFINDLTQEQRLLLINTMIDGDGWSQKNSKTGLCGYIQKNKKHIDAFIALCTLAGKTTSCKLTNFTTPFGETSCYMVYIYGKTKHTCKIENINMYGGKPKPGGIMKGILKGKELYPNKPTELYQGLVWCPKTLYGTWVCRRENYVHITGNTYKEDMIGDAIIKMLAALKNKKFNPEKGNAFSYFCMITHNAFCNRIKKEKRAREVLVNYQNEVFDRLIDDGYVTNDERSTTDSSTSHEENILSEIYE